MIQTKIPITNIKPLIIQNQAIPMSHRNYTKTNIPNNLIMTPQVIQGNKTIRRFQSTLPIASIAMTPKLRHMNTFYSHNKNNLIQSKNYINQTFTNITPIKKRIKSTNVINGEIQPLVIRGGLISNPSIITTINNTIKNQNLNENNILIPVTNLSNNINNNEYIIPGQNIVNNGNIIPRQNLLNNNSPNIKIISNTIKHHGYSNDINSSHIMINKIKSLPSNTKLTMNRINLFGKGANITNNIITFDQNLGNNIVTPNNKFGLVQPNILNNSILINNIIREPYETVNLAEYQLVREIGKGTFGRIYEVIWMRNNKHYALKKEELRDYEFVKVRQRRNDAIKNFIRKTHCNGVVSLYGNLIIPMGQKFQYFELMEMCERDFEQEIKARAAINRIYTEMELMNVMFQMISTLSVLQKNHITHRDIKPQNILISNGIYKLCDFGDIRVMQREGIVIQRVRGSELYMSPILFNGLRAKVIQVRHNTYKSDVFSLGMCFFLAACLSYDGLVEIRELTDMNQKLYIINKYLAHKYSQKIINIIYYMLQTEEQNRPDFINLEYFIKQNGM